MAVFMLSLTGIPPLVGFWGKLFVFRAAVEANLGWLAVLGVINSAISAFYYLGVLVQMYMRSAGRPEAQSVSGDLLRIEVAAAPIARRRIAIRAAVLIAVLGTLLLGLWPVLIVNLVVGM
jgi:NADH-quinone oxidoreductase subunit N